MSVLGRWLSEFAPQFLFLIVEEDAGMQGEASAEAPGSSMGTEPVFPHTRLPHPVLLLHFYE